jgi:hypothetical protein
MSNLRRALFFVALVVLAAPAAADVLVVDPSGDGEFLTLVNALNASQDGDTLLLRPGDHGALLGAVVIFDRSLTIAADGTGPVLMGPISVLQPSGGKRVVLRGLTVNANNLANLDEGLRVSGGDVFAEDCSFTGRDGFVTVGGSPGGNGVLLESGRLVLKDCTVRGGRGVNSFFPYVPTPSNGGAAVVTLGGTLAMYGGSATGGRGGDFVGFDGGLGPGGNGGRGVHSNCEHLLVAGTTVAGGQGGDGDETTPTPGQYQGGPALAVPALAASSLLGTTLVPGVGGFDGNGTQGAAGVPILSTDPSTVVIHPGPYRGFSLGAPTPEGDLLQLDYSGVAGDLLLIFVSPAPGLAQVPGKQGVWHLGAPLLGPWIFGPVASPAGTLSLSIPVPSAGLGPDDVLLLYEQLFVKPASGPALLSSPTLHLIVDGSL